MKHLKIIYFLVLYICYGNILSAQTNTYKFDPKEKVYWFYLNVSVKTDKIFNRDVYVIRLSNQKPKYDTYSVFEKEVWRCLQTGHQLVIGPFMEYEAARRAIRIYDLCRLQENQRETEVKNLEDSANATLTDYYCYFVKFYISERTKSFRLKRIPARTSEDGVSLDFFIAQFLEGVTMEMLAIGPFPTREEAEDSKRLNRLEE